MFEITVEPVAVILHHLQSRFELPSSIGPLSLRTSHETPGMRLPFIQLAHSEIAAEEVDRLLGYADIVKHSESYGLHFEGEPMVLGSDVNPVLLYPLSRLNDFVRKQAPDIAGEFDSAGGMDGYVERKGDAMTAMEYLAGGLLECIRVGIDFNLGVIIRW